MKIVQNRRKFLIAFVCLVLVCVAAMAYHGKRGEGLLNWDVDFIGGLSMELDVGEAFDSQVLENLIVEATGQARPRIQQEIGTQRATIKLQAIPTSEVAGVLAFLQETYPSATLISTATVSGTVSQEMQQTAVKATLIACVAMLIYISFRFRDVRAGVSAIVALGHDVFAVIAVYAILRIPVDYAFIAVLLTTMGYSINATIVIFDRIRENKEHFPANAMAERMNKSIAQTLSRSINTSITTLLAIGAVYVFGVSSIREFALPIMVGIVAGAYSSICLSSSVWYALLPKADKT